MAYTLNRRLAQLVDSNGQLNTGKIPNDYITGDHIADNVITSAMLHTSFTVSTSNLTAIDTDDVSEGLTNLYFTNERVDDRVNALLTAGTGITLTYDDANNTLTIAGAAQYGDSDVESYLSGGTGVTFSSGVISIGQDVSTSATPTFGNITTTGYIAGPATFTIDPAAVGDNTGTVVIAGNLQVDGTTTTINSTTMTVDDLNITLASGAANAAAANGAGITVDGASATITYDATNDEWDFNKDITTTGYIGAGTSNPANLLHLESSGSDFATIRLNAPSNTTPGQFLLRAHDGVFDIRNANNSTTDLTIDASGNVGIGTSSPAQKLEISDTGVQNVVMRVTNNDGNAEFQKYQDDLYLNLNDSGNIIVRSGTSITERMRIDSSGNIGIGTSSPSSILHLSSSGATRATIEGTFPELRFKETDTTDQNFSIVNQGGDLLIRTTNDAFDTATTRMIIDSSGNVGIGNSSPQRRLTVGDGSGSEVMSIYAGNASASALHFTDTNTATDYQGFVTYDHVAEGLRFGAAEVERMRLTATGLGIGETDPDDKLHITVNGESKIRLEDSSSPATYSQITNNNGNLRLLADQGNAQTDSNIQFFVDGTEYLTLQDSGVLNLNGVSIPKRTGLINYFRNGDAVDTVTPQSQDDGTGASLVRDTSVTHNGYNTFRWNMTNFSIQYADIMYLNTYFDSNSSREGFTLAFWAKNNCGSNVNIGFPGGGGGHIAGIAGDDTWRRYVVFDEGKNSSEALEARTNVTGLSGYIWFSELMIIPGDARYLLNDNDYIPSIYDVGKNSVSYDYNYFVRSNDPATNSNPLGGIGSLWINTTSGETYVCTDATEDSNTWKNVGEGSGDILPAPDIAWLVIGGGGAGTGNYGGTMGGGGAGGMRSGTHTAVPIGTVLTATVGAGGTGVYSFGNSGQGGGDSTLTGSGLQSITSFGGGGGGGDGNDDVNGGSGGGQGLGDSAPGSGTAGQGNNGGASSTNSTGGGGGGAGAVGGNGDGSTYSPGDGGDGATSSITGSSTYYAGGGGGGGERNGSWNQSSGGLGGGGAGGVNTNSAAGNGTAGTANTGGGGGAASKAAGGGNSGGSGGSGVVILRVETSKYSGTTTGSPTITTDGLYTVIKFTGSGTYTA